MDESLSEFSNALSQNKSCVHVWRAENGVLNEVADLGTFYTQSIYLVLSIRNHFDGKPTNIIYLWAGGFSNSDEEGHVNERIQVLYGLLRSSATIHHEYERHECESFLNAFIPYGGVRYRTPGLEYVTNRGFCAIFSLEMSPAPHWIEIPACVSALKPTYVCFMRTRTSFNLWLGYDSQFQARLRGAELCGAFRQIVGREESTHLVYQGNSDSDFLRSLSANAIENPQRAEPPAENEERREIYQVATKDNELDFIFVAMKNEASLNLCTSENAYVLREQSQLFVWFGKAQKQEGMAIGLVVAVVFMQKFSISRCTHVQIVREGEQFSSKWT